MNTGRKVQDTIPAPEPVREALEQLEITAPQVRKFRNAVSHPEDNSYADGLTYFYAAVRLLPGGRVEYVIDPRYGHHEALAAVVEALRAALLPLVAPLKGRRNDGTTA